MTRWLRWLVGTSALLVVAWAGYWTVATYALSRALTECGNEVLQEAPSTDGRYVASAFERGCGATSPFVRIVSIRPGGSRFDGENKDEWAFALVGQPDIRLTWTGPEHLTVKYGGGARRVVRQAVIWNGVTIAYE